MLTRGNGQIPLYGLRLGWKQTYQNINISMSAAPFKAIAMGSYMHKLIIAPLLSKLCVWNSL